LVKLYQNAKKKGKRMCCIFVLIVPIYIYKRNMANEFGELKLIFNL
jgi:uncharacterized membrane protein YobD (UPF0266 family)